MPIGSAEANRRLIHLAFRDAHTALDLTYGAGRFWQDPLPPGLTVTSNNLDPEAPTDLHLDFTATDLPSGSHELVIWDPPHLMDGGKDSIMAARYGTVKGILGLMTMIHNGALEAWRIASVGILVKVIDSSHGGELIRLSDWVQRAIRQDPYILMHTYRPGYVRDGKHKVFRVPRNNGAVWLCFRKDGPKHLDFDRLYERQQNRLTPALR